MPPLPDVVIEEIRLPLDEPACLVRASVASKLWLRELTGARFRGRYLDFHGTPPMLGFLYYRSSWGPESVPQPDLLSTTGFRARLPGDDWDGRKYVARDCRHGRVLLEDSHMRQRKRPTELAVWNPMTGRRWGLAASGEFWDHRAAVLCAVAGCDHCACHDGPFRVVLVGVNRGVAHAWVSSPETGEWSKACPVLNLDSDIATIEPMPAVLVQGVLYFLFTYFGDDDTVHILKYDLCSASLSTFLAPATPVLVDDSILVAMQDGSLGFACLNYKVELHIWSRQIGSTSDGLASWTQRRVIDVKSLFPVKDPNKFTVIRSTLVGSVEGSDVVFVTTDMGIYEINFTSLRWKKLWKPQVFTALIPYVSFYSPQALSL